MCEVGFGEKVSTSTAVLRIGRRTVSGQESNAFDVCERVGREAMDVWNSFTKSVLESVGDSK